MKTRATLLALLLSLFGFSTAFAAPYAAPKNAKLSMLAKTRDRDERGRFLSNVKSEDVQRRAYFKYQDRIATGAPGSANGDYLSAKRELQEERRVQNAAAKLTAKQTKLRNMALKLGDAWGAKVTIDGKVATRAAQ